MKAIYYVDAHDAAAFAAHGPMIQREDQSPEQRAAVRRYRAAEKRRAEDRRVETEMRGEMGL